MKFIAVLGFLLLNFSYSSFKFDHNHEKQVKVIESFDVKASFLKDPILIKTINNYKKQIKRHNFFKAMKDSYLFLPTIKDIIAKENIPSEFLYLAMAESNFSTKAYSKKRATGMWQFMKYTGKIYGLKIDRYVDERKDLIKATKAASKYIKYLYKRFGKWYLAALAYNCGEGRLIKAIKKAKTDDLKTLLIAKKKYLPKESRYYIRKILALSLLSHDEEFLMKSDFKHLLNRGRAYSIASVEVKGGEKLTYVASLINMDIKTLHSLNRNLIYTFTPPYSKKYEIYIPYSKLVEFNNKYKPSNLKEVYIIYKIKAGDTLYKIGKKHSVDYKIIKDFNGLRKNLLSIGKELIIPVNKSIYKTISKRQNNKYIVKEGDTLFYIAKKFNIQLKFLMKKNNLVSSYIKAGDKLLVR